jgi:hypothetical protein
MVVFLVLLKRLAQCGLGRCAVLRVHPRQPGFVAGLDLTDGVALHAEMLPRPHDPPRGHVPVPTGELADLDGQAQPLLKFSNSANRSIYSASAFCRRHTLTGRWTTHRVAG